MTWPFLASAAALLLLLAADVFRTVFDPEGHGGPLTRMQTRLVWRMWKAVAPRHGDSRRTWLSLGGPALAVLTPATWACILVAGFALVYYPWIADFLVSPGTLRAPWSEALYFSGYTAATLGTGDIVPDLPALRLMSIVEGLCGFALLSAALSYILAIYRENGRKTTLASDLALHYDLERQGLELQPDHAHHLWLKGVARELLHITNAHSQYPILHYFRPKQGSSSLTLQIGHVLSGDSELLHPGEPGTRIVAAAADRYLEAADTQLVPDRVSPLNGVSDRRYGRLLEYLAYGPDVENGALHA